MKRSKIFKIKINENYLELCKNKRKQIIRLFTEFLIWICLYALLMNTDIDTSKIENYFVFLFYLPPLLRIPAWIKMTRTAINGERLLFDKESKEFSINGRIEKTIDAIERIELNYDIRGEVNVGFLDLKYRDGSHFRIEHSDAYWDEEIVDAGNKISRFLGIDLVNNHPYEEKMLEPANNPKK